MGLAMDELQSLKDLFRHMEWADSVVWRSVLANKEATKDAQLRDRLHHIHLVQHGFLLIWKGITTRPPTKNFSHAMSVLNWAREYYIDVTGYLNNLTAWDIAQPVEVPWAVMYEPQLGRKAAVSSLKETMSQVVLHTTHHRGQVCTKLKELGGEPPLIDFIVWVWAGKPEAVWPDPLV